MGSYFYLMGVVIEVVELNLYCIFYIYGFEKLGILLKIFI